MRVLHVSEFIQGGTATYLDTLLTEQSRSGEFAEIQVIITNQHNQALPENTQVTRIYYDYPRRDLRGLVRLFQTTRNAIRQFRPDLVHLHGSFPGLIGRLPGIRSSLFHKQAPAVVYSAHGWSFLMERSWKERKAYLLAERLLSRNCDRIICISQDELQAAWDAGLPKEKCRLVYNALAETAPCAIPVTLPDEINSAKERGEFILLFVGRYDQQKGIDILLDAFRRLSGTPIWLLAAGDAIRASERPDFISQTINLSWMKPGEITSLLGLCDAMIVPSRWEGFGLVAAEAARAGKAVICSNRGGLPEVVEHGVTGIVFDDLSSEGIAKLLRTLDRNQLKQMGEAGRSRFQQHFLASRMYAQTQQVYLEAIAERSGQKELNQGDQ